MHCCYGNIWFDYQSVSDIMAALPKDDACLHLLCMCGTASVVFDNRVFELKKYDVLVVPKPRLITRSIQSADFAAEVFSAPLAFLGKQLPANNFAIGGSVSLYGNPVLHLCKDNAAILLADFASIKRRMPDTAHPFYLEMMGSLCLTMMYDLFAFHMADRPSVYATERSLYAVKEFMSMLDAGYSRKNRSVAFFAKAMHVSPKYLSETVRRHTGKSASYYINMATLPMVKEMLDRSDLSVSQIAEHMNFGSVAYFSRYVSRHLGVSPKKYRSSIMPTD